MLCLERLTRVNGWWLGCSQRIRCDPQSLQTEASKKTTLGLVAVEQQFVKYDSKLLLLVKAESGASAAGLGNKLAASHNARERRSPADSLLRERVDELWQEQFRSLNSRFDSYLPCQTVLDKEELFY
ncbi:hypothetical protein J6590_048005 [Homalodisca vitripennis]|nr:hypothetical protein J6590_048005 [Homalodisca vitripennis]